MEKGSWVDCLDKKKDSSLNRRQDGRELRGDTGGTNCSNKNGGFKKKKKKKKRKDFNVKKEPGKNRRGKRRGIFFKERRKTHPAAWRRWGKPDGFRGRKLGTRRNLRPCNGS